MQTKDHKLLAEFLIDEMKYTIPQLHQKFSCMLSKGQTYERNTIPFSDFQCIEILHEEYLRNAGTCENDCKFILNVSEMVFEGIHGDRFLGACKFC